MKLTKAQKRAIQLGRDSGIIGYFGNNGYGDYSGNFIAVSIMKRLVEMG